MARQALSNNLLESKIISYDKVWHDVPTNCRIFYFIRLQGVLHKNIWLTYIKIAQFTNSWNRI